jgi:predicted dinucleotide-binding enzyme
MEASSAIACRTPTNERISNMTIGIIGAGSIGAAFARRLARASLSAILSNSRGPDSLADLVTDIGGSIRAGTREEAAAQELVLVAVNWSKLPTALRGLPDFRGRIVIDANNPIEPPTFQPTDLHGRLSTQVFAEYVPGARVVKAFNHLPAALLAEDPRTAGGRRVLFFAGSDASAKAEVADLIEKLGFHGIDLGLLTEGGKAMSIPGGGLTIHNLIRLEP